MGLFTRFCHIIFVFNMGAMLQGLLKIAVATGNALSPNNIVMVMTVAFYYTAFWWSASAYTNMIQVLIIILSMLLIHLAFMNLVDRSHA
jgi:hypothetical protein